MLREEKKKRTQKELKMQDSAPEVRESDHYPRKTLL